MTCRCEKDKKDPVPSVRIIIKEQGPAAAYRFLSKKVWREMESNKNAGSHIHPGKH